MKERPVLFTGAMVRAIQAGTKTQTRRIVQPRKDRDMGCKLAPCELAGEVNGGEYRNAYCAPGDRLWVRESHSIGPGPGVPLLPGEGAGALRWPHVTYSADGATERRDTRWKGVFGVKRPSIHMHRWASRITLEVTGVRTERLQAITAADAVREGCAPDDWLRGDEDVMVLIIVDKLGVSFPVARFVLLWDSINDQPGLNWNSNPWVWVIQFQKQNARGQTPPSQLD